MAAGFWLAVIGLGMMAGGVAAAPLENPAASIIPASGATLSDARSAQRLRDIQRRRQIERDVQRRSSIGMDPFGPGGMQQGQPSRPARPSGSGSMTVPNR